MRYTLQIRQAYNYMIIQHNYISGYLPLSRKCKCCNIKKAKNYSTCFVLIWDSGGIPVI